MTEVPAALEGALVRRRHAAPSKAPVGVRGARVQRGDIRLARSLDGTPATVRLVLVSAVVHDGDVAEVMLTHTAAEMACEVDAVVVPDRSSAPHDIVVQTDLRAVVWTWQLDGAVGRVDDDVIAALRAIAAGSPPGSHVETGVRLAGPLDPRWAFKRDEGESLRRLASDCTDALLDRGSPWVVHPDLLRPDLLDAADDCADVLAELMHWLRTRELTIRAPDVERLVAQGAIDPGPWAALDDLGLDVRTAVQALVERSATAPSDDESEECRLVAASYVGHTGWPNEPLIVHQLGRKEASAA